MHVCSDRCRSIPGLVAAHERSRLSARARRQGKFKGARPKVRWLGGHLPPQHWIDEMWAIVEGGR